MFSSHSHTTFHYNRFDENHIPETWLANAGPLERYLPSDVIMGSGISKGYVGCVIVHLTVFFIVFVTTAMYLLQMVGVCGCPVGRRTVAMGYSIT